MKKLQLIFGTIIFGLFFISCDKENDQPTNYDQTVLISADLYKNAPGDRLNISKVEINGNFLKIKFAASGCSGSSWEVKLIDSGAVFYSNPPQRNLRVSLKNQELCHAVFEKEIIFDIKHLQVNGNRILLNIINSGHQVLYKY